MAVGVEAHAERARGRATARGASRHRTRGRARRTSPRPARSVSRAVQVGRVVDGRARRRARPAPSSSRSGPAAWRRRARRARRCAGRGQRRVEARRAGADDGDVGLDAARAAAMRGYGTAHGRAAPAPPPVVAASTTPAPHPERAGAHRRDRAARSTQRDWLGWDVRESPRGRARRAARPSTPALRRRASSEFCAAGGGALDADTVVSARLVRGGAARRRRRGRRWSTRCWAATARASARRCTARRATTREPARAMGFCLFNNVAVAAQHALDAHGARAGADPRLGRPPRQRDERHLPRDRPTCCSSRSTSRRCIPGTGPASDARLGRGGGLHGQPAGAGRLGRRGVVLARRARRRPAGARVRARGSSSSRRASTRTRDDPLAGCARDATRASRAMAASRARGWPTSSACRSGVVLEGGYDLGALARRWWRRSRSSGATSRPTAPALAVHPLAARGRRAAGRRAGPRCAASASGWRGRGAGGGPAPRSARRRRRGRARRRRRPARARRARLRRAATAAAPASRGWAPGGCAPGARRPGTSPGRPGPARPQRGQAIAPGSRRGGAHGWRVLRLATAGDAVGRGAVGRLLVGRECARRRRSAAAGRSAPRRASCLRGRSPGAASRGRGAPTAGDRPRPVGGPHRRTSRSGRRCRAARRSAGTPRCPARAAR